jgi:Uma2 family endonuclease
MNAALRQPVLGRMTADEFMAWPGDGSGRPCQLVGGELVAMAPPSEAHARIHGRIAAVLGSHLERERPECSLAIGPGVAPPLWTAYNVRIPDIAVTCTPHQPGRQHVESPVLVAQILSPSNERETRLNVWAFASIPSVCEILLVRSVEIGAELLRRGADGGWPEKPETISCEEVVELRTIGGLFPLARFYAGTALALPGR